MLLDFSGKTILVVGGSSGIGNGIAQAFRACGGTVHVTGTRPGAAAYAGERGSDLAGLSYLSLDVSQVGAIERQVGQFDKLDVLVLSQGHVEYDNAEFERPGWDRVMSVNLDSLMHCAHNFHSLLQASRGVLLIVSSIAATKVTPGNPAYAASKAGAVGLTRTLGLAWAGEGIRVNGIAPGFVETKLTAGPLSDPAHRNAVLGAIPCNRLGQPADVGYAALFLASPLASYIVGHTLAVDGGMSLN